MTPEEAISIINDVTWQDNGRHYGKIKEAREMAVSALGSIHRLGKFGKLFQGYEGCPRGAVGRSGLSLEEEVLSMPEIVDVDGGKWIPVNADALTELVDNYKTLNSKKVKKNTKWINIADKLPEEHIPVLVFLENDEGDFGAQLGWVDSSGWWYSGGVLTKEVTHWIPLPEPPCRRRKHKR